MSRQRNLDLLKKEISKIKPSVETTKTLLRCTFLHRYQDLSSGGRPPTLQDYLTEYSGWSQTLVGLCMVYVSVCLLARFLVTRRKLTTETLETNSTAKVGICLEMNCKNYKAPFVGLAYSCICTSNSAHDLLCEYHYI